MTGSDVQDWIDGYVDAWRSSGTSKLADIFSNDVSYSVSPWKPAIKGLPELENFWEQARSGPDEVFKLQSEIVAIENNTAVVRVEVRYANGTHSRWRDLWIITFDSSGLCCSFEEWPFSPEQDDGQYHHVATAIFVNKKGKFILQRRDDRPGVRNPGMLTAWGGAVQGGETPLQAMMREVREETNLKPAEKDLEFFGKYLRNQKINGAQIINHVFILKNIDENSLKVFEGQDYAVVDPLAGTDNVLFTDLTKELIRDYIKKYRR